MVHNAFSTQPCHFFLNIFPRGLRLYILYFSFIFMRFRAKDEEPVVRLQIDSRVALLQNTTREKRPTVVGDCTSPRNVAKSGPTALTPRTETARGDGKP